MKRKKISLNCEELSSVLIETWRRHMKLGGPKDHLQTREFRTVCSLLQQIEEYLDGTLKEPAGTFYTHDRACAYMLYHWFVHMQQGLSIFGELPASPRQVLELCTRGGPFAYAALRHGASTVHAFGPHQRFLSLASEVIGRLGYPISVIPWRDTNNLHLEQLYDLIVMPYMMQDIFDNQLERAGRFVGELLEHLTEDGHIVFIERSCATRNKTLLQLRALLSKNGLPIYAPCLCQTQCPALESGSLCFAQRSFDKPHFIQELQRGAKIFLGSLKMSYLILSHPKSKVLSYPPNAFRVVSPPCESQTGRRYYLCGALGKRFVSTAIPPPLPKTIRAFEFLERGALITIDTAYNNGEAMDLHEGSSLRVVCAPGKPPAGDTPAGAP